MASTCSKSWRSASPDFGRVQPVRLHEHDLAVLDRVVDLLLRAPSGILEDGVPALDFVQVGEVRRRRHEDDEERVPECADAHVPHVDAVAQNGERVVVGDQAVPVRELAIRPHRMAEEGFGRRNGLSGGPERLAAQGAQDEGERRRRHTQGHHGVDPPFGEAGPEA
jgi:hypothetical protein